MKNLTDMTIILDRSGSMEPLVADMIGGFNRLLDDQRVLPDPAVLTLVQFDHEYEVIYSACDVRAAPGLTRETYLPRGTTALLDAMGRTIESTGRRLAARRVEARPSRVIVVTMTDGLENASRAYSRDRVFEMITHQRSKYAWEFVFVGANQDAIATADRLGVAVACNYTADSVGTANAFAGVSRGLGSYRSGGDYNKP